MSKLHIKKGDTVIVNTGVNKGQSGKVLKVFVKEQRAIVEGVNKVKKSQKPSAKNPQGGIVEMEAPLHISNLNPVDPKTGKATRIGRKLNADGKLVRYAKKSGEEIKLTLPSPLFQNNIQSMRIACDNSSLLTSNS